MHPCACSSAENFIHSRFLQTPLFSKVADTFSPDRNYDSYHASIKT